MKKFKVETRFWKLAHCYSCIADIGGGRIESSNCETKDSAMRSFIRLCNRLGIPRENYEFEEVKK